MGTQAVVSIVCNDRVLFKIVAGCDGYNAQQLADAIEAAHPVDANALYDLARRSKFGCRDCLVVQSQGHDLYKGDGELGALYRECFGDPHFNPRWGHGTASHIVIISYEPENTLAGMAAILKSLGWFQNESDGLGGLDWWPPAPLVGTFSGDTLPLDGAYKLEFDDRLLKLSKETTS